MSIMHKLPLCNKGGWWVREFECPFRGYAEYGSSFYTISRPLATQQDQDDKFWVPIHLIFLNHNYRKFRVLLKLFLPEGMGRFSERSHGSSWAYIQSRLQTAPKKQSLYLYGAPCAWGGVTSTSSHRSIFFDPQRKSGVFAMVTWAYIRIKLQTRPKKQSPFLHGGARLIPPSTREGRGEWDHWEQALSRILPSTVEGKAG